MIRLQGKGGVRNGPQHADIGISRLQGRNPTRLYGIGGQIRTAPPLDKITAIVNSGELGPIIKWPEYPGLHVGPNIEGTATPVLGDDDQGTIFLWRDLGDSH